MANSLGFRRRIETKIWLPMVAAPLLAACAAPYPPYGSYQPSTAPPPPSRSVTYAPRPGDIVPPPPNSPVGAAPPTESSTNPWLAAGATVGGTEVGKYLYNRMAPAAEQAAEADATDAAAARNLGKAGAGAAAARTAAGRAAGTELVIGEAAAADAVPAGATVVTAEEAAAAARVGAVARGMLLGGEVLGGAALADAIAAAAVTVGVFYLIYEVCCAGKSSSAAPLMVRRHFAAGDSAHGMFVAVQQ